MIAARIVIAGPLGQGREEGDFGDGELVQRLAEIIRRRRGHAVGFLAEENLVQIKLEDLILGKRIVDAHGENHLADLAREFQLARKQEIARHLLRDGRSALRPFIGIADVVEPGADDAENVDTRMAVEILVFRRQESLLHLIGNLLDGYEEAPLAGIFSDQRAVAGINAGGDGRLVMGEQVIAGKIARDPEHISGREEKTDQNQTGQTAQNDISHQFHLSLSREPRGPAPQPCFITPGM